MLQRSKKVYFPEVGSAPERAPSETWTSAYQQETAVIILKLVQLVCSVIDETFEMQRVMRERYPRLSE